MIEIEVINACLAPVGVNAKDTLKYAVGIDSYCVIKSFGKELGRTELALGTYDPIWHEKFGRKITELSAKENVYNRPFYLENIDIEIYEVMKPAGEKHIKIFETKVPISNVGLFKSYRLIRSSNAAEAKESLEENRIFVKINRLSNELYDKIDNFKYFQLCDVCPTYSPLYRHLYMDFSWSPSNFTYTSGLPGPSTGERCLDKYHYVEVILRTVALSCGSTVNRDCLIRSNIGTSCCTIHNY
jgi:hypothetical protein